MKKRITLNEATLNKIVARAIKNVLKESIDGMNGDSGYQEFATAKELFNAAINMGADNASFKQALKDAISYVKSKAEQDGDFDRMAYSIENDYEETGAKVAVVYAVLNDGGDAQYNGWEEEDEGYIEYGNGQSAYFKTVPIM